MRGIVRQTKGGDPLTRRRDGVQQVKKAQPFLREIKVPGTSRTAQTRWPIRMIEGDPLRLLLRDLRGGVAEKLFAPGSVRREEICWRHVEAGA